MRSALALISVIDEAQRLKRQWRWKPQRNQTFFCLISECWLMLSIVLVGKTPKLCTLSLGRRHRISAKGLASRALIIWMGSFQDHPATTTGSCVLSGCLRTASSWSAQAMCLQSKNDAKFLEFHARFLFDQ